MKSIKKENLMPTIVLGTICIVVAAVLALLNMLTAPAIAEETERRQTQSLTDAFPSEAAYADLAFEELTELSDVPDTVTGVYREKGGRGYAVLLSTKTNFTASGTAMNITVAVDTEGKILGICLTSYTESKDIGKDSYPKEFYGKDKEAVEATPHVSGASYSSRAFRAALADALAVLESNGLTGGGAS